MLLTVLAALLAGDDRLLILLQEPARGDVDISVHARLLILAEIRPSDSFDEVWLEYRDDRDDLWQPLPIPESRRVRVSATRTIVGPMFEPRSVPGVRAGDTLELRICAASWVASGQSETLTVRVREADEREALLLSRVEEGQRAFQALRTQFEGDHRKLSRIERKCRDAETLEAGAAAELQSLESEWTSRLDRFQRWEADLLQALDEGGTDQLVHPRKEDRWRKAIAGVRRITEGPLTEMKEALARAGRSKTPEERGAALRSTLDASDRFIDLLEIPLGELEVWLAGLDLRRKVRAIIQAQKDVTGELDRERQR